MSPEKLVYMANQIATFFQAMPHDEAVAGIAEHINKFWEPRMRVQFFDIIAKGGTGLKSPVLEAVPHIHKPKAAIPAAKMFFTDRPAR